MSEKKGKAVVVTTSNNGVYFGYIVGKASPDRVVLRNCRNCLYWDDSVRGYVGLSVVGPGEACFVGPAAPEMTLYGVESIAECTEVAVAAWESAPWGTTRTVATSSMN